MPATAIVVRPANVQQRLAREVSAPRWAGVAPEVHRVSEALGTDELKINALFFEPGVRFRPHSHAYDQVLYYVSGTGVVAVDGGEDIIVSAGEMVLLPAKVPHMHGATNDGPACHISMMRESDMDFACPIPEHWRRWREQD